MNVRSEARAEPPGGLRWKGKERVKKRRYNLLFNFNRRLQQQQQQQQPAPAPAPAPAPVLGSGSSDNGNNPNRERDHHQYKQQQVFSTTTSGYDSNSNGGGVENVSPFPSLPLLPQTGAQAHAPPRRRGGRRATAKDLEQEARLYLQNQVWFVDTSISTNPSTGEEDLSPIQEKYKSAVEAARQRLAERERGGDLGLGGEGDGKGQAGSNPPIHTNRPTQPPLKSNNVQQPTIDQVLQERQQKRNQFSVGRRTGSAQDEGLSDIQRKYLPAIEAARRKLTQSQSQTQNQTEWERVDQNQKEPTLSASLQERIRELEEEETSVDASEKQKIEELEQKLRGERERADRIEAAGSALIERINKLEASQSTANNLEQDEMISELESKLQAERERADHYEEAGTALEERINELESARAASSLEQKELIEELERKLEALESAWTAPPAPPLVAPPTPPAPAPQVEVSPLPEVEVAPIVPEKIEINSFLWRHEHGREIILQGFHWESHNFSWYNIMREKVPEISSSGFTGVWFPPASDSIAPQGYLPRDLYKLDTEYGSFDQLRSAITCMQEYELHAMADIVINHRCATSRGSGGKWNRWDNTKMAWDERAICRDNPDFGGQGSHKAGDDFTAAPNIDHSQDFVRDDLKEWLRWLVSEVGFRSLRFDFVKGYSGNFVGEYIEACQPEFSVGEFWDTLMYSDGGLEYNQDHHRQRTVNWVDQTKGRSCAFDFTTKGILQEACGRNEMWRLIDGKQGPPGMIGIWPSHAVTFIDNHDTGSSQSHWPFPADKVLWGYAYTLTHPGTPSVFWEHFFDWGSDVTSKLAKLIEIRKRTDIHSRSKVKILKAESDVYAAEIDGKVCMKIGSGSWSPGSGSDWNLSCSGNGFAVWEKK